MVAEAIRHVIADHGPDDFLRDEFKEFEKPKWKPRLDGLLDLFPPTDACAAHPCRLTYSAVFQLSYWLHNTQALLTLKISSLEQMIEKEQMWNRDIG